MRLTALYAPQIPHCAAYKHYNPTWKLSKPRAGILSSNSRIVSHGPSPTPTKIIESGCSLLGTKDHFNLALTWATQTCCLNKKNSLVQYLAATIAFTVASSCGLECPGSVSTLLVTCSLENTLNSDFLTQGTGAKPKP